MKKRLFAILVSVSLLSTMVLSGCGQNSTDEKVTSGVIRIAYNNIENYPHYKGLERAAQEIEDRSDGRFTVKIYSNGTLGDQRAALELTQNNAVQMCVANATMVESYYCNDSCNGETACFLQRSCKARAMAGKCRI